WMPNMAEARILREEGDTRIVYQRVSPPIVDDRDYTLRIVAFEDQETGVFEQRLSLANDRGPPPVDGVVRVLVVEGGWLLEPVGKNKTRILYWLHTDPGGAVPGWAFNVGQQYTLPDQIEALRRRAGADVSSGTPSR
ncbi:MAG: START domain-containing protein, partial [Myxococcota bacterium]